MPDVAARAAPPLLRDQRRAGIAYQRVAAVLDAADAAVAAKAYKSLVLSVGVDIRRMGLSAALAVIEREKHGALLLADLRRAPMHVQPHANESLPAWVRGLDITTYMVVTRELLQFVVWLRRAVQALVKDA